MERVYLGLGTNLGNKEENLERARMFISKRVGKVLSQSSLYETEPWGNENQEEYLNQVIVVETGHYPLHLLKTTQGIETEMGRIKKEKWGSRIIDIDILFYGNQVFNFCDLVVPHPFIAQRKFVLEPFFELEQNFIHPQFRKPLGRLLMELGDSKKVDKLHNP